MKKFFGSLLFACAFGLVACDSDSGTSASEGGEGGSGSGGSCSVEKKECLATLEEGTICDARDGQVYKITTVGDMTWLAENLKYYDCSMEKTTWCYDNKPENCEKYGRLYSWTAAMGLDKSFQKKFADLTGPTQGACPEGFHIPSEEEWLALDSIAEATGSGASPALRSTTGWEEANYPATDALGFGALPAGRKWSSMFKDLGKEALFWKADEDHSEISGDGGNALLYSLGSMFDFSGFGSVMKDEGLSVRCVK